MMYEIPMTTDASQEFVCTIGGQKYLLRVRLNVRASIWTIDVNTINDEPIVTCLPLVLGVDLLSTERFTNGMLFLVDYSGRGEDPSADNFDNYGLIWTDNYG